MSSDAGLDAIIEKNTKNIIKYLTDEGISKDNLDIAFSRYLNYGGEVINTTYSHNSMNIEMVKILYMKKFQELYRN